jgi:hypothetical protein
MSDVITDYQKWKQQGEGLRVQARQAMEARFRTLLTEAAQLAEEYKADFGAQLKPPAQITAFRYKNGAKPKKAAGKPGKAEKAAAPAPPPVAAPPSPKVAALQKRIAVARKKFDDAKAAGSPTRPIEDKIYELEDELRLLQQS